MSSALSYIHLTNQITTEFTYVDDRGIVQETYNHSVHIRGLHDYAEREKNELLSDFPGLDPKIFSGTFYSGNYDVIFLSSLIESGFQVYCKKETNVRVVMNHWVEKYIKDKFVFAEKYQCEGPTSPEQYVQFLSDSLKWLPNKTKLCIILGSEFMLKGYEEMARAHMAINNAVKELSKREPRILYIDVNEYTKTESDFTDTLNHYQTRVYYEIAKAMTDIIMQNTGVTIKKYTRVFVAFDRFLKLIRKSMKKHLVPGSRLYDYVRRIYQPLVRKRNNFNIYIKNTNKEK